MVDVTFMVIDDYDTSVGLMAIREKRRLLRHGAQQERKARAKQGWWNWYVNRRRLSFTASKSELRRVSWRRAL